MYVGKAKNLKNRVTSYFAPLVSLGPKTQSLVKNISTINYIEVASEVEALLLESRLIKKFKPPFNIVSKDDKSPYYISLTHEAFPKPIITHEPDKSLAGPFLTSLVARRILKQFRKIAPFCTSPRPVKKPCLYSHLGLCSPCPATHDRAGYTKNIHRLKSLLKGNFVSVLTRLKTEMLDYSKHQKYEEAGYAKQQIDALNYLLHPPISPDEYISNPNLTSDLRDSRLLALSQSLKEIDIHTSKLTRIEMYDIANISGSAATGAMTVAFEGEIAPRLYRHFTIRSKATPDDVAMLKEVLTRRLKNTSWPAPDLIVLDGGQSQLSIVSDLQLLFPDTLPPIISLAKKQEILMAPHNRQLLLPKNHAGLLLLEHLRDEAHRFSRKLHHKHRQKLIPTRS